MNADRISIKATTTDFLGFIGEKKGVAAFATALLKKDTNGS
jgi:2C-methyl-D-erythritol 2,4-cyclodiphosphate synthase